MDTPLGLVNRAFRLSQVTLFSFLRFPELWLYHVLAPLCVCLMCAFSKHAPLFLLIPSCDWQDDAVSVLKNKTIMFVSQFIVHISHNFFMLLYKMICLSPYIYILVLKTFSQVYQEA